MDITQRSKKTSSLISKALVASRDGNLATLTSILENAVEKELVLLLTNNTRQYDQYTNPFLTAAAQDHFNIVEMLLVKYGDYINVDQSGNVYLKTGKLGKHVTPLYCAALNGNMEMVKILVCDPYNANVNHRALYNTTAIRAACSQNHLDVVKYLFHRGADIHVPHSYDKSTCLTVALANKCEDVASFLLSEGIDPNVQTSDTGTTAFHLVAQKDINLLVDKMIEAGAFHSMKDNRGLTPLQIACEALKDNMVSDLTNNQKLEYLDEERIHALELLGASHILHQDFILGHYYLRRGMSERFENSDTPVEKHCLVPVKSDQLIYGRRQESKTVEELEEIKEDENQLRKEAMLVMERILGENNVLCPNVVIKDLLSKANVLSRQKMFFDSIALYIKALNINQNTQESNSEIIHRFVELFAEIQQASSFLDANVVVQIFEHCLTDLEQEWLKVQYVDYEPVVEHAMETVTEQVKNVLGLISIAKLMIDKEEDFPKSLLLGFVSRFVAFDLKLASHHDASPLHIACTGNTTTLNALRSPNLEVVDLLLEKGADINAVDRDGNSPFHVLASYNGSDDNTVYNITLLFLDSGAHLDARNKEGSTPLDLANPVVVDKLKESSKKVPLKCLAAQTIKRYFDHYQKLLPRSLSHFVDIH